MKNREKNTKYNNSKNHTKIIKRHERNQDFLSRFALRFFNYCVNCTKFGQLILRIIIKIDATRTRCQILRLKCTKIVFGWGSAPDCSGGAYDAHHTPSAGAPPFSCLRHSPRFCRTIFMSVAPPVCVYCVNCTKFGQLILRIIIKIDATRCQIF